MADNSFRTTRRDAAAPSGQQSDDPLAELARLIGRNPPAGRTPDRSAQHYDQAPLDAPQSDPQWASDTRYAEQQYDQQQYDQPQHDERHGQYADQQNQYDDRHSQYGEGQYSGSHYGQGQYNDGQQHDESQYDDRHDAPRLADPHPPAYGAAPQSYNSADYEQSDRYAAPPQQYDTRGYSDQPRHDDAHDPVQEVPAFLPRMRGERRDDRYDYAQDQGQSRGQAYAQGYDQNGQDDYERGYPQDYDQAQEGDADDGGYALEDYEDDEEAPAPRRRGFAIAAALVGVMVLGTAGWFAYGAMFGGSGMPSLPPIIRADNTPNKIIPANSSANASGQATANSGSPDKLVSREEKPVDVPTPGNTPRVVSTVPVFPDPGAGMQSSMMPGGQNMAGQNIPGAVASGGPGGSLGPTAAGSAYGSSAAPAPQIPAMAPQNVPPLQSPPVAGAGNAKKIHTVAIHNGQPDNADTDAPAPTQAARPAPARPVAAAPQGGNGPMSIVPSQGGAPANPAPPARTALARPQAAEAAPSAAPAGSGYFVQVSSQRSEADAQSAYHGLQAKFPSQLGGREATIRQVDLGEKGTYYRTLVGPYASMDQAAQMCSSLKAAGGSCLVQRN
jgi:cell division protein FtsN